MHDCVVPPVGSQSLHLNARIDQRVSNKTTSTQLDRWNCRRMRRERDYRNVLSIPQSYLTQTECRAFSHRSLQPLLKSLLEPEGGVRAHRCGAYFTLLVRKRAQQNQKIP